MPHGWRFRLLLLAPAAADLPADDLARQLYEALQRGENSAALEQVPAALDAATDRPALAARIHAWEAQAATVLGDGKRARAALRSAQALATAVGDDAGVAAIAQLRAGLMQALLAHRQAPPAPPDTPVARANAAVDRGELEHGAKLAEAARHEAQAASDPREEVLALLVMARIPGRAEPSIREAARVADQSNDRNLVTAVAHAARAAGVDMGVHIF